jgi:hypothetical protein
MNKHYRQAFILLLSLVYFTNSDAQENRTGTASGNQLLIPVGTVGIGMGGAVVATTTGIEAMYWNPAGLASYGKGELMFSSMNYLADIKVSYFGASANISGVGTLGLTIKSLDFGEIPVTTDNQPEGTGATYSPSFITAGLTYSRLFTDRVSVGITGKFITETIGNVTATAIATDIGIQYKTPFDLKIGVAIRNLGTKMRYQGYDLDVQVARNPGDGSADLLRAQVTAAEAEIPSLLDIGVAYDINFKNSSKIVLAGNFRNNNFTDDEYQLGVEFSFQDLLFFRAGYNFDFTEQNQRNAFSQSLSLGAGLNYRIGGLRLMADYAYRSADPFDGNQVFSIKVGF